MKTCFKCKIKMPKSDFGKNKNLKDGLHSYCLMCSRNIKSFNRKKYLYKEKEKAYRRKNKEKIYKKQKAYREKNKEKIKKYKKEYRKKNKERLKQEAQLSYMKHKDERKEQYKALRSTCGHVANELFRGARRRAKNKNINFSITKEWVLNQIEKNKYCPITNEKFVIGDKTVSPLSRTLDRKYVSEGYTKTNTILVSNVANTVKSNSTIEELKMLIFYLEKINNFAGKTWLEKIDILDLKTQTIKYKNNRNQNLCLINEIVARARRRSRNKNILFSLKNEDVLIPTVCPVFGFPLVKRKEKGPGFCSPSIDRINNNKGYTPKNIQIISNKANIMKHNLSLKEITKIYNGYCRIFC